MKNIFIIIIILTFTICKAQNNPKVTYKNYKYEFIASDYPKSITDSYKNWKKLSKYKDNEIAIIMNADIILEELLDNVLRINLLENIKIVNEKNSEKIKSKLKNYYQKDKLDFYNEKILTDKTQQWIADSIIQKKYGGKIYYEFLKRTPKPREAYQRLLTDLMNKNEIKISDNLLKSEILKLLKNYNVGKKEFKCNFNLIETWK